MQYAIDLVVVTLATGAIVDVWHNGSIFAESRAYVQALNDSAKYGSFRSLWTELILCPFCKSYHIPIYLFAGLLAGDYFGGIVSAAVRLFVFSLAATRASNIVDGLLPQRIRYDRE